MEGDAIVQRDGSCTTIDSIGGRIVVRVPVGADLVIGTTSASVEVEGPVGQIAVVTKSGRVSVDGCDLGRHPDEQRPCGGRPHV